MSSCNVDKCTHAIRHTLHVNVFIMSIYFIFTLINGQDIDNSNIDTVMTLESMLYEEDASLLKEKIWQRVKVIIINARFKY